VENPCAACRALISSSQRIDRRLPNWPREFSVVPVSSSGARTTSTHSSFCSRSSLATAGNYLSSSAQAPPCPFTTTPPLPRQLPPSSTSILSFTPLYCFTAYRNNFCPTPAICSERVTRSHVHRSCRYVNLSFQVALCRVSQLLTDILWEISAPNPPQSRAINEIKRLLSRSEPDFATAKTWVARAIGGNVACLEPFRNAVARKGLPEKQKLDFLIAAVPEADAAIVRLYGKDCFSPGSEVYGHFWRLAETRGFVRLLLDIVFCAADAGDWETAVQYSKRILQMNHGDNNGMPRGTSPPISPASHNFLQESATACLCSCCTSVDPLTPSTSVSAGSTPPTTNTTTLATAPLEALPTNTDTRRRTWTLPSLSSSRSRTSDTRRLSSPPRSHATRSMDLALCRPLGYVRVSWPTVTLSTCFSPIPAPGPRDPTRTPVDSVLSLRPWTTSSSLASSGRMRIPLSGSGIVPLRFKSASALLASAERLRPRRASTRCVPAAARAGTVVPTAKLLTGRVDTRDAARRSATSVSSRSRWARACSGVNKHSAREEQNSQVHSLVRRSCLF
jgi:hypothetical protein